MNLERKVTELERKVRDLMVKKTERTRWEWYEERINPTILTIGGGTPTAGTRAFDTGGTVLAPTLDFSNTVSQGARYVWHSPEDLNSNLPVYIHAMWVPGASWTSGNYYMQFYYIVADEDATLPVAAYSLMTADVTPANATDIIETEYATGISMKPDQLLAFYFYRHVGYDNGNAALQLLFLEVEYARWI